jgi:hypothetical protein
MRRHGRASGMRTSLGLVIVLFLAMPGARALDQDASFPGPTAGDRPASEVCHA